jgi:tetratricopeptide (TPR) repeat protein
MAKKSLVANDARVSKSEPPKARGAVEMRLAIGQTGVGLELASPTRLACFDVIELSVALPTARFPIDVSGGVARFRHRRGALERVLVEVNARDVERWLAPRLRGVVSPALPEVWASVRRDGATVSLAAPEDPLDEHPRTSILAFDIAVVADGEDLVLVVLRARGSGLGAPATALAISALDAALAPVAVREGGAFRITRAGERVARTLVPEAGMRAPSSDGVVCSSIGAHGDTWILRATSNAIAATPSEDGVRARESAALLREADDALLVLDLTRARALDLVTLERAPRHPEVGRRIAEIDELAGGRAEAALATLLEMDGGSETRLLVGELSAEAGDVEAAIASFARGGDIEPTPALGARAFERAAELSKDDHEALVFLDRALARSPRLARLRWARVRRRLAAGRIEDARADVGHLEATVSGARAKHALWKRAGDAWTAAGFHAEAATMFERALRFIPDDPAALAGLGEALVGEGREARGVAVLARAAELAATRGSDDSKITLALAKALAEGAHDLSAAVARARSIPHDAVEALEARGLEGRWRARLGDLGGAALAYARMRELAASRADDAAKALPFLVEAAAFERDVRDDAFAAQRHLAVAVRFAPRDAPILAEYRAIGAAIAHGPRSEVAKTEPPPPPAVVELSLAAFALPENADARADELSRILQADPSRDDVVDELARLLHGLGRSHELFALLSARLEDASPDRRVALLPATRMALSTLEASARAEGHDEEASLFRDFLAALDAPT